MTWRYTYDPEGNLVTSKRTSHSPLSIISPEAEWRFDYDKRDSVGNWIKRTKSDLLIKFGKRQSQPVEVTYRTISYYSK